MLKGWKAKNRIMMYSTNKPEYRYNYRDSPVNGKCIPTAAQIYGVGDSGFSWIGGGI